jgi:hypothetical protein
VIIGVKEDKMRSELRFLSNALVYVTDESQKETKANLQNLSQSGLSIKSETFIDIVPNSFFIIAIIPEEETNIEKFKLEIESRCVKLKKTKMESGFSIIVPFDEKGFNDYLAYLTQKAKETEPPKIKDS